MSESDPDPGEGDLDSRSGDPDSREGSLDHEAGDVGWLGLDPGESVRWRGRPRSQTTYPWIALAVLGAATVAGAIAVEVLPIVAAAVLPLLAVPAVWTYLRVSNTDYVVTDAAVSVRSGVLGVEVVSVEFDRIQNTAASQHALGAIVGYGTVEIDTAGGESAEISFRNVEDPQVVRALIDESIDRADGDDVPGTVEEWEAILAEIRGWRRAGETGPK